MTIAKVIFWFSLGFIVYVYVGYPLLLIVWRRIARRRVRKLPVKPSVTIVLVARNERDTIADKLVNCLEQDYPRDRMQLIVSLDGPTDGTDEAARQRIVRDVVVLHDPRHRGKAAAINRAVAAAHGEVVVFVDARQRLDSGAIRELVANFADPEVGAVSGELIMQALNTAEESEPMDFYWRYEKWIRRMESEIHSSAGATGALYAVRRSLIVPLPEDTILDDVAIPLQTVLSGKRISFDPAARAYDRPACCPQREYARKVRTLTGNFQLLTRMPALLLPWRNPIFLQFVSHKVGRLLVPYCLLGLLISNFFLTNGLYLVALVAQVVWYLLALAGAAVAGEKLSLHSRLLVRHHSQESS